MFLETGKKSRSAASKKNYVTKEKLYLEKFYSLKNLFKKRNSKLFISEKKNLRKTN